MRFTIFGNAKARVESEHPTGELRWRGVPHTTTEPRTLQQKWLITTAENHVITGSREEWRDVPVFIDHAENR